MAQMLSKLNKNKSMAVAAKAMGINNYPPPYPLTGDMYYDTTDNIIKVYKGMMWSEVSSISKSANGDTSINSKDGSTLQLHKGKAVGVGSSGVHLGGNFPSAQIKTVPYNTPPAGFPVEEDVCIERLGYDTYCKAPLSNHEQREHRRCATHMWEFEEVFTKSERDWVLTGNKDIRAAIIGLVRHVKDLESTVIELQNQIEELQ